MGNSSDKREHFLVRRIQSSELYTDILLKTDPNVFQKITSHTNWKDLRVGHREWTLLHLAVWAGHLELVSRLVEAGLSPSIEDVNGDTAIDLATELQDEILISYFKPTQRQMQDFAIGRMDEKPTNSSIEFEMRNKIKEMAETHNSSDRDRQATSIKGKRSCGFGDGRVYPL